MTIKELIKKLSWYPTDTELEFILLGENWVNDLSERWSLKFNDINVSAEHEHELEIWFHLEPYIGVVGEPDETLS